MKLLHVLFAFLIPAVLPGCAPSSRSASEAELASFSDPGFDMLNNFHRVSAVLYRSGHVVKADMPTIKGAGIKTIVSLEDYKSTPTGAKDEEAWAKAKGLSFIWVPMSPKDKPTNAQMKQALALLVDQANQPVLVHCHKGSDRTGLVVAAYRMTQEHWTEDAALTETHTYGHGDFLAWWDDVLDSFN